MPWITLADTDIGGRAQQQDRFLIEHSDDGNSLLLVVADGAGGHKAGALAAQTAIDCIVENVSLLWTSDDPGSYLYQLIIECNQRVLLVGDNDLACTTLVLVFVRGDEIFWGHVGDSRFYLVRDRDVVIRTTDHSLIELQREQAAKSSNAIVSAPSNKLYMCLGASSDIVPEVASSLAKDGDALALCSDGLWGQIEMEPFVAELSEKPLTMELLNEWVDSAKSSGASNSDNITLVAAKFVNKQRFWSSLLKTVARFFMKLK